MAVRALSIRQNRFIPNRLLRGDPFVTPAEAGVQKSHKILDSRFRGNDNKNGENCLVGNMLRTAFADQEGQDVGIALPEIVHLVGHLPDEITSQSSDLSIRERAG